MSTSVLSTRETAQYVHFRRQGHNVVPHYMNSNNNRDIETRQPEPAPVIRRETCVSAGACAFDRRFRFRLQWSCDPPLGVSHGGYIRQQQQQQQRTLM